MDLGPKRLRAPNVYWASFKMLYDDLEDSFRFVEPCPEHLKVYSLRYYELLLRACTEFESLCKEKVLEFGLTEKSADRNFNIADYWKLNELLEKKPSKAGVGYRFATLYLVTPLQEWEASHTLEWYTMYNLVKHNRVANFRFGCLENVLNAIGALFILLERFRMCPPAQLGVLDNAGHGLLRCNDEWPVLMSKPWH